MFLRKSLSMPSRAEALPGRPQPIPTASTHFINHRPLKGPYPEGFETAMFGMGCFWGAERKFWELGDGVHVTAVGYAAGLTPNPTYEEVCSGRTGHNEVVLVVYDPKKDLLRAVAQDVLGEPRPDPGHAAGQRRGHPVPLGDLRLQQEPAGGRGSLQGHVRKGARGDGATAPITTEILDAPEFYFAEDYHQQYLAKNPHGYCGLGGTGVSCPIGTSVAAE